MATIQKKLCPICGSELVASEGQLKCERCNFFTLEYDDSKKVNLIEKGIKQLNAGDFFNAFESYSELIKKFKGNFAGYWGSALAKFFVRFVNGKPICFKYSDEVFSEDENYIKAKALCENKDKLEEYAKEIEESIKEFKVKSDEINYDVFLLSDGESELFNVAYEKLVKKKYEVFYAPKMDFKGANEEQIIAMSLDKSKVLFCDVVGKDGLDNLNLSWQRFYAMIKTEAKAENSLIFTYKDMLLEDFPKELKDLYFLDSTDEKAVETICLIVDALLKKLIKGPLKEQLKLDGEIEKEAIIIPLAEQTPVQPKKPPKRPLASVAKEETVNVETAQKAKKSRTKKISLAVILPIVITAVVCISLCVALIWAPQIKSDLGDEDVKTVVTPEEKEEEEIFVPRIEDPISDELKAVKSAVATNGYYIEGDYIWFGEYPQVIMPNSVVLTETVDSRGYYLGKDGEYYAKVIASPHNLLDKFSNDNTIVKDNTYYFRVDPIKWRIVTTSGGDRFLLSNIVLDGLSFGNSNVYSTSKVRDFLNGSFFTSAFTSSQKSNIFSVLVNNSTENPGATDTTDNVFILNETETESETYSFEINSKEDSLKSLYATDYARAKGVSFDTNGNGSWWTRSKNKEYTYYVTTNGKVVGAISPSLICGIVPALNIRLS